MSKVHPTDNTRVTIESELNGVFGPWPPGYVSSKSKTVHPFDLTFNRSGNLQQKNKNTKANVNTNVDVSVGNEDADHAIESENVLKKDFEFQKNYPITRYSRKWTRPEVQGLCWLTVDIACLVTLALLGLGSVGYFNNSNDNVDLSFSWKVLWQFFGMWSLPKIVTDCLQPNVTYPSSLEPITEPKNFIYTASINVTSSLSDENRCEFRQGMYPLGWFVKFFMVTNLLPVINIFASSLLYMSVSIRRRRSIMVRNTLFLPAFLSYFFSMFQVLRTVLDYMYCRSALNTEMQVAFVNSIPPYSIVPILDKTQAHHQCCGLEYPENWMEPTGNNSYPRSCCNTNAFNCSALQVLSKEHIWSAGCLQKEQEIFQYFERWALLLYCLKLLADMQILGTLSQVTTLDYPPPEVQETSRCEYRDYRIVCRGIMHIKGVTTDGRVVLNCKFLFPDKLTPLFEDITNGLKMYLEDEDPLHPKVKGCVKVVKIRSMSNFLRENIKIDLSQQKQGSFVVTLI